ncbi:MAG: hypothetical protein GVY16_06535 [Planctomycetes bacterium]|jgi:hypothetical protein|nr:hypothetical protein [Phycisphaerae bacterium]NBB95382.1 hypothetical protein [Planctomycetota bacterium]
MRHICLSLLAIGCLGLSACENNRPEAEPAGSGDRQQQPSADPSNDPAISQAEAAIQETDEPQYEQQGGVYAPLDYLSVVMQTPARAKLVVSQNNMRVLGHAIKLHKMRAGGFPKSLDAMVASGALAAKATQSPGNPAAEIVYLQPTDKPANNALLAFDPVGYSGGTYVMVTCGGGSRTVSLDDLKASIRAREGKVVQPKLELNP